MNKSPTLFIQPELKLNKGRADDNQKAFIEPTCTEAIYILEKLILSFKYKITIEGFCFIKKFR
jgi:hypothetical protein